MNQYFHSVIGYVFIAIFMLISGYYFSIQNLLAGSSDIRYFFSNMVSVLVFLIPMLTMRLFAEEKKTRTEQLLLTLPISLGSIVISKYLAAMAVFSAGMLLTTVFPVTLSFFGEVDLWVTVGNYFGLTIMVGSFVAIGLFISSLTENQVIAAVVSYCVLFGLWLIGWVSSFVQNKVVIWVVNWLSILQRYNEFTLGIFNPASVVYYFSIIFTFLFLTVQVLEQKRRN